MDTQVSSANTGGMDMGDVDTELKAVGKVFKDVVPQFVENVKELSSITNGMKKRGE